MSWKAYPLVFRLKSPLHIGWRKVGNLHQTRPYVTGKVIWAALTARMTRQGFKPPDGIKGETEYIRVGKYLTKEFAFSYFFPALEDKIESALSPKLETGGINYGNLSESEFQYLLLDSYASTALDYSRLDKEEGSLHETDFIRPRTRPFDGEELGLPVYLVGYIFSKNGIDLVETALDKIQLGAERRYGWGRIELKDKKDSIVEPIFHDWQLKSDDSSKPEITAMSDTFLPAHGIAANPDLPSVGSTAKGIIEPLVGRETTDGSYFGRKIADARICWLPGSQVLKDTVVAIGDYGIWQGLTNNTNN